jgi:hypothetical protein
LQHSDRRELCSNTGANFFLEASVLNLDTPTSCKFLLFFLTETMLESQLRINAFRLCSY